MMNFRRAIINTIFAASLTAGFAFAQDAPPPPDSQYPATPDANASGTPQYQKGSDPQFATPDSIAMQQDQGGYGQGASAPPPPPGQLNTAPAPAAPDQQMVPGDDSQDPSSRVARMQFMDGQVSIQPGGVNDWVAGTLNRPMTTGDNVWTDKDSKAELNVGTGVFRMGAETSLTLANVADKTTQIQLHQGTLNLRVRHLYDGEVYEIDTPNTAFTVQKPGDYRFDVDPNADTSFVTVWKGEGNSTGDGPAVEVRQGEKARFSEGTSMAYQIDKAPGYDQFDQWAMNRDQRDDNSVSAKYVSPDVIGSADLDNYGKWQQNQDYGNVWVPNDQDQNWQPYSNGNWIYQQPYGWSWVGYEPWGFAPYHYGRWVRGGWGWGWAPGPYAYWGSPYYAPALVGWYGGFGWGGGFGFGFGGGFGWCALGWGEPFHPWYRHGGRYFANVNIRNTRINNINNYYGKGYNNHLVNYKNGLVTANGNTITHGLNVRNNRVALNNTQRAALEQHPVNSRSMGTQLHPTAQSRVGAQAAVRNAPPARATSRGTVSHLSPPAHGAGATSIAARGGVNGGRGGVNNGGPAAHNVPRPTSTSGQSGHGAMPGGVVNRPSNAGSMNHSGSPAANGHYVPRPPSAGDTIGNHGPANMPNAMAHNNSVPRPGGSTYSRPGQSYSAPHSYAAPQSRSYGNPGGYGGHTVPGYGNPSSQRYSGGPYGGGRAYGGAPSAPHYSAPSAPHYSAPSGGGGHYSAPSSHGGGGGHYSGGGGGGHASGGGGHSGGGHR